MHIVIISILIIPKCNFLQSKHWSLPGHVNSRSGNQGFGLGHSLLKEELVQHSGRKYPVGIFICICKYKGLYIFSVASLNRELQ